MNIQLGKWGHSLAVRLPKAMAKEVGLHEGSDIRLSVESGGLVIKPARRRYTLSELLRGMAKNRHEAIEDGPSVGREAW